LHLDGSFLSDEEIKVETNKAYQQEVEQRKALDKSLPDLSSSPKTTATTIFLFSEGNGYIGTINITAQSHQVCSASSSAFQHHMQVNPCSR